MSEGPTTPTTPQDGGPRLSRRALLGWGGALAGLAAAGTGAAVVEGRRAAHPASAASPGLVHPFTGEHQAGIATAAQDRLYFAAFDLTTTSRDDVIALLRTWTVMAARMTQGLPAGPFGPVSGPYDAPPDDTGEAMDLPAAGLTVTFGFGRSLFVDEAGADRFGLAGRLPAGLADLPHFPKDALDPARSGGDLVVQACADDPQVAVHAVRNLARAAFGTAVIRWAQLGFGRTSSTSTAQKTPRNLFGFKDGTDNLKAESADLLDQHVWVPASAASADATAGVDSSWLTGGSYLVARRIRMTIETWDRSALREQERVIGRDKREGAPLSGGTEFTPPDFAAKGNDGSTLVNPHAHMTLGHPDQNGGRHMLRRGYNFTDGNDSLGRLDAGLFFIAFVTDPRTHYVPMQTAMARDDLLSEYLQHTGSGLWAVPPGVPDLPTGSDGSPALTADGPFVGQALFA
ncbi:iron uptake transporter deferrochelatase/peroxidase subunit [Cellulomonas citrea]|uniref:iron uptake transporter deferrochelatase/peroxidase subunit n=1 Tax=Cellulomonas citrea TaxID=1909423 RepID=UPI0013589036|nr:iron uptake transporter deferrochelatase/peroxidase subunit [Cellulomonas citrea]